MLAPIAQRLGLDQVQALGAFALLRHLASVRPGAEGRPPQCGAVAVRDLRDLPIAAAPLEGGVGEDKIRAVVCPASVPHPGRLAV